MNQNTDSILAVVTVNKDKVSGGAPIFLPGMRTNWFLFP
jgi:hypothetical protein